MKGIHKIKTVVNDHPLLRSIRSAVKGIVNVNFYYLYLEKMPRSLSADIQPGIEPVEVIPLGSAEVKEITRYPEKDYSEPEMLDLLTNGCKGVGISHNGRIVSYGFYNLSECHERHFRISLKKDEAYLFGQRTLSDYRGKNLAPFLRYAIYKQLSEMGYHRFYSLVDFFNNASIRFKQKLDAQPVKLFAHIRLLKKLNLIICLKRFRAHKSF